MKSSRLVALGFALITLMGSAVAVAEINMGVFPRRPTPVTSKIFKPLAQKLSEILGEPVNLLVAKDFHSFWQEVVSRKYDIVHFNQYHYLLARKNHGYKVFAINEESGSTKIAGAISVRKDTGINTLADLKGKTILFGGGTKAMGSYIGPTYLLKQAGMIANKDYNVRFAKNPPSAVIAVFNGAADAAGSGTTILETKSVNQKINVTEMKILAKTPDFTQLPWAAKIELPAKKIQLIRDTMTSLKTTDKPILQTAQVTNFVSATDKDFESLLEIVEFVTGEKF